MDREAGFESMERYNQRGGFQTEQSKMTPEAVAKNCYGVMEMKAEAMDEAYGMAGKSGQESMMSKAKSQFLDYNWA
ncbi:hypothetical protein KC887_08035 [Candidatus Kaiserbacteria bacterium]|nr:hypothetical protein [Candidatus Kaiserbacteria bacterium]